MPTTIDRGDQAVSPDARARAPSTGPAAASRSRRCQKQSDKAATSVGPDRQQGRRLSVEHRQKRRHRQALNDASLAQGNITDVLPGRVAVTLARLRSSAIRRPAAAPARKPISSLAPRHRQNARGVVPKPDRLAKSLEPTSSRPRRKQSVQESLLLPSPVEASRSLPMGTPGSTRHLSPLLVDADTRLAQPALIGAASSGLPAPPSVRRSRCARRACGPPNSSLVGSRGCANAARPDERCDRLRTTTGRSLPLSV